VRIYNDRIDLEDAVETSRIYSCDDHLDINALPRNVWSDRLPAKYRDAGPITVEQDGKTWWTLNGRPISISGRWEGFSDALQRVPGLDPDGMRAGDPRARLEDMERDGIWASIVYGPLALTGYEIPDPEHKKAVLRAWNDWAAEEFNSPAPGRLSALPMLPTTSPEDAAAELYRVADLGHVGALFHCFEVDLLDKAWDRLWGAAEETGLPINFHIGGGTKLDPKQIEQRAMFAAIVPLQLDEPFAIMIYGGALERHPGLKIVLAESGVGWLPYMVARMDATYEKHCTPYPGQTISTPPSVLFERQVYATFEEEPLGKDLIPLLPADNIMWACDYPHPDSTWPDSATAIEHALGSLGEEVVRKVTGENCRRLYGLP
jgi:predicted TIM-barrel fold metal-dependent hydrolase